MIILLMAFILGLKYCIDKQGEIFRSSTLVNFTV